MRRRAQLLAAVVLACLLHASVASRASSYDSLDDVARGYVLLVLRIDQHEPGFNDYYYGPADVREQVTREGKRPLEELRAQAEALRAALPNTRGNPVRRRWFEKQLAALETKIRMLQGEQFSVAEQARRLFDLEVQPPTNAELEAALTALDQALPGPGSLLDRVKAWRAHFRLPPTRVEAAYRIALEEVQARARKLLLLPPQERVELYFVTGQAWGGYNWFQGNARSRIEINTDLPTLATSVYSYIAHEAYPGHHTDLTTREQRLFHERGYFEWCVSPLYTPQSTMAEAVAEVGKDILMPPAERYAWHRDVFFPRLELAAADVATWEKLQPLLETLSRVRERLPFMLHDEGASEEAMVAFLQKYALMDPARARKTIQFDREWGVYSFNYTVGREILRRYLATGNARAKFIQLLTIPIFPSLIEEWIAEGAEP
ncbi:MAG: hypothetical protein ACE5H2_07085 [Terriglobia bacterium]